MTTPINGALPPPPKQIRFVNNQGQPPSKRRRINAAYVPSASCISIPLHRTHSWAAITVAGIGGRPMPEAAVGSEECMGVRMSRRG
jgi:hypothetical protein